MAAARLQLVLNAIVLRIMSDCALLTFVCDVYFHYRRRTASGSRQCCRMYTWESPGLKGGVNNVRDGLPFPYPSFPSLSPSLPLPPVRSRPLKSS